ncbi:hypothetical protein [Seinonella peptonophila]|uniref:hypothetical protein n=1 Tax=Seinonella peptonophila TaxID=112248 RepID=UPI003BF5B2EC
MKQYKGNGRANHYWVLKKRALLKGLKRQRAKYPSEDESVLKERALLKGLK